MFNTSTKSIFGILVCGVLTGCGGGTPAPAPAPAPAPVAVPGNTPVAPSSQQESPAAASTNASNETETIAVVDPDHKETKWIGKIPYDVFYDQPLTIATDTTALGNPDSSAVASVGPPGATPAAMPAGGGAAAPAAGASTATGSQLNWAEILPMPQLVEEVKSLRTQLTADLQTVATYNKSQKEIALDGAILTALASVATVHPEETSWKSKAHFVRDLAFEINANSGGSGREPYTKTKEPFDKILVILDGGKPPEMESPETVPFSDVVYVADMMQRIDATFTNLKANVNTEARLKEDPASAEREMRMMWLLGTMMSDSSYDYTDEKKYQDYVKRFTDGTKEGVLAIQTGNMEGFLSAMNQVQTTCAECHQQYRGNDSGF